MKTIETKTNIITVSNAGALAHKAIELFVRSSQKAVAEKGLFYVAMSGGYTPRLFFELLGQKSVGLEVPWSKTHLFWVDEHCVEPDSDESNYKLAADTFLPKVGIPPENVHRIFGELHDCRAAARSYEKTITNVFGLQAGQLPKFDLIVLGMGDDAHTGSLFRGSYAVFDKENIVCAAYFMDGRKNRITLTHPVLCEATSVVILVSGKEKATILEKVITSEPDEVQFPIHTLWPALEKVTWVVDKEAAKYL